MRQSRVQFAMRAAVAAALAGLWLAFSGTAIHAADKGKNAKSAPAADDPLRAQLEGKTPPEKIAILDGILESGKPTKEAWFHMGNARYENGDPAGAAAAFQQAVAIDSTFFKAAVNLGLMYDEQQRYPEAIEAFELAARLQPKNPDVWSHMGNTYYAQSNHAKANELYHKALQIDPNATHALYSMGVAFADAGIFREAVKYWRRVVELEPQGELGKNAAENVELVQKYLIP